VVAHLEFGTERRYYLRGHHACDDGGPRAWKRTAAPVTAEVEWWTIVWTWSTWFSRSYFVCRFSSSLIAVSQGSRNWASSTEVLHVFVKHSFQHKNTNPQSSRSIRWSSMRRVLDVKLVRWTSSCSVVNVGDRCEDSAVQCCGRASRNACLLAGGLEAWRDAPRAHELCYPECGVERCCASTLFPRMW